MALAAFGSPGAGCGQDMPGLGVLARGAEMEDGCLPSCGYPCCLRRVKPGETDPGQLAVSSPRERWLLVSHGSGCDGNHCWVIG